MADEKFTPAEIETLDGISDDPAFIFLNADNSALFVPGVSNTYWATLENASLETENIRNLPQEWRYDDATSEYLLLLGTPEVMQDLALAYQVDIEDTILFLPGYQESAPDEVVLRSLQLDDDADFYALDEDTMTAHVKPHEQRINVDRVIREACVLPVPDGYTTFNQAVLVLPTSTMLSSGIEFTLDEVQVYTNVETDLQPVNAKLRLFSGKYTNPFYYSAYEADQRSERNADFLRSNGLLIASCVTVFSLLLFATISWAALLNRQRDFQLLTALGASRHLLETTIFTELALHAMTTLILSVFAILIFAAISGITTALAGGILIAAGVSSCLLGIGYILANRFANTYCGDPVLTSSEIRDTRLRS